MTAEPVASLDRWDLCPDWRTWLAASLAAGASPASLIASLVAHGVDGARAGNYVDDEAQRAPRSGDGPEAELLRQLARSYAHGHEQGVPEIDTRRGDFEDEFTSNFRAVNRPVILRGFATGSVLESWSFAHLKLRFGPTSVMVQERQPDGGQIEAFRTGRQVRVNLGEFLDFVQESGGNARYLTGNDRVLREPGFGSLVHDLAFRSRILDPARTPRAANLWIGGAGAVSPLHRDFQDVLNVQVLGRKRFTLAHPGALPDVYAIRGKYSLVDADAPDYERFPRFTEVALYSAVLEPHDALFIPVGWWHHVRALEPSANLSFTNLAHRLARTGSRVT